MTPNMINMNLNAGIRNKKNTYNINSVIQLNELL